MAWFTALCRWVAGASESADPAHERDRRAEALTVLLFEQQSWQLRKVQSHQLLEGRYSVVKVSVDCVPQDLPGLEYTVGGQQPGDAASLIVPVTYMEKGVLRQFDMRGPDGQPLPVIGRSEYTDLMLDVLMYQCEEAFAEDVDSELLESIFRKILDDEGAAARKASEGLLDRRSICGKHLLEPKLLSGFAKDLISSLASSYVLFALIPREYAGRRVVIKYSHNANQGPIKMPALVRLMGAAGLGSLPIAFELSNPTGAASHHLEVSVPPDLSCSSLRMPGVKRDRNTEDSSDAGVVHTASSYSEDPREPAVAEFTVPWSGMRATTCLVSVTTFLIMYLGIVLPGAQQALLDASDGAAALLLGVPAVAVAFAAGRRESAVESVLLGPLRFCVLTCALLLLASAASLVGVLHEPWRAGLWVLGAAWSGTLSVALCTREAKKLLGKAWGLGIATGVVLVVAGWVWALLPV